MDSQACVDPWGGEDESYDDDDEDDDVCPKGYVSQIKKEYTNYFHYICIENTYLFIHQTCHINFAILFLNHISHFSMTDFEKLKWQVFFKKTVLHADCFSFKISRIFIFRCSQYLA